jgi:hypothetical protein
MQSTAKKLRFLRTQIDKSGQAEPSRPTEIEAACKERNQLLRYSGGLTFLLDLQIRTYFLVEIVRLAQGEIMNSYPNWFLKAAALESVYPSRQKSRCRVLE